MKVINNTNLQETIISETLPNGLNISLMPRNNYNSQYAIFATKYGSIDNCFINLKDKQQVKFPEGIAHFLEHKLFEGEKEDVFAKFAQLGANSNAFTNYTMTSFHFSCTNNFHDSLVNLLDFVQSPYFTDENVEKEKNIITQEIKMYEDDPEYQVFFNLLQGLYNEHPVKVDIAGTIDSIYQIKKEDLYLCYNTFYHPRNMCLFLVGDFIPQEVLQIVAKNQDKKDFSCWKGVKRIFPIEPDYIAKSLIEKKMDVAQPLFALGFKENNFAKTAKEMITQEMGTNILLELIIGKSSRLYQSLYEKGYIDDNFYYYYVLQENFGYVIIGGEAKEPEKVIELLLQGIKNGQNQLIKEDVNRIYKKYLGEYIESFNNMEFLASEFVNYFFKGINYLQIEALIKEINLSYLLERYEILQEDFSVRSIVRKA